MLKKMTIWGPKLGVLSEFGVNKMHDFEVTSPKGVRLLHNPLRTALNDQNIIWYVHNLLIQYVMDMYCYNCCDCILFV